MGQIKPKCTLSHQEYPKNLLVDLTEYDETDPSLKNKPHTL